MPLPTLANVTLNALVAELANRLSAGGTSAFWVTDELKRYMREALRTWNAYALYWRAQLPLTTSIGVPYYDLSALTGFTYNYLETDAITEVEYALLEPINTTAWSGSEQYTFADLTTALDRNRNAYVVGSRAVVNPATVAVATPLTVGRQLLPNGILDVHRAAWLDSISALYSHLWRDDEIEMNAFAPGWQSAPATPQVYSVAVAPPMQVQLAPTPVVDGTLDLLVVPGFAAPNPGTPTVLGLPDDLCWAVRFGMLADLLAKDAQVRDYPRSQYCAQRYEQGLALGALSSSVMQAFANGANMQPSSLQELDSYMPNWRNSAGPPQAIAVAGRNLIAVAPVPDAAYSITLDCVVNAPIPADPAVAFTLHADLIDVIIDYAYHLAAFKMGGGEFTATSGYLQQFLTYAQKYRRREDAQAVFSMALRMFPAKENARVEYEEVAAET